MGDPSLSFDSFAVHGPWQLPFVELSSCRATNCLGLLGLCRFYHGKVPCPRKVLYPEQTGAVAQPPSGRHLVCVILPNSPLSIVSRSSDSKNRETGLPAGGPRPFGQEVEGLTLDSENLENVMLSEGSWTRKRTYSVISFLENLETENESVGRKAGPVEGGRRGPFG